MEQKLELVIEFKEGEIPEDYGVGISWKMPP